VDRGHIDRWIAADKLQLPEEEAAEHLASLRRRGYLVAQGRGRGTSYRLIRSLSDALRGREETDLDAPLDDEGVRLRIEAILRERGELTNAEIRRITGYSRSEVLRITRELVAQGVAKVVGRGRGAHYVPGPKNRKRK
jgi:DNA-binding IclR family transcriptional regulator